MTIVSIDNVLGQLARKTEQIKLAQSRRGRLREKFAAGIDFLVRGIYHVWRNRRYLTTIKLANMALINIQCNFKTERVVGLPYRMKIESTNICNTKCQLCPTGIGLNGRNKGKMSFEQYKRLVSQLKRYLYELDLSMWGDPLIVPDIYKMIRYAHDQGIWTYISSNMHAFKPDKGQVEQLVQSGLNMMTCSLHGATQLTYETYQPGKNFEQAIAKIKAIQKIKKQLGSDTPHIQLNFVVMKFNQHEIEDFKQLAKELGCTPVFSNPSLNLRFLDKDKDLVSLSINGAELEIKIQDQISRWLPDDDDYVIEPYQLIRDGHNYDGENYNGHKLMACHWPWKDSVINWDGSVVTCCGVFDSSEDMGNVFEQPFHEIWNNKNYRMARRSFKKSVDANADHTNPCRDCPGFMI